jgi:hypothetical protein
MMRPLRQLGFHLEDAQTSRQVDVDDVLPLLKPDVFKVVLCR